MLFSVNLKNASNVNESILVSASTWSQCLSYAESTGSQVISIGITELNILRNNPSITEPFNVALKDNDTQTIYNYLIYDTFGNTTAWVEQQINKSLLSIIKLNRQFIVV